MGQEQSYYVSDVKKSKKTTKQTKQTKISGQSKRISQVKRADQGSQYIQPKPPSEPVQVKQAEETESGTSKTEDSKTDESGKATAQVEVQEESPHVQQTTQVQTITVPRPEEPVDPSKHLRTAKEYKEWADRTAFFFPPKK